MLWEKKTQLERETQVMVPLGTGRVDHTGAESRQHRQLARSRACCYRAAARATDIERGEHEEADILRVSIYTRSPCNGTLDARLQLERLALSKRRHARSARRLAFAPFYIMLAPPFHLPV